MKSKSSVPKIYGYVSFEIGNGGKVITPYTLTIPTKEGKTEVIATLEKRGESFFGRDITGRPNKITHFRMKHEGFWWHGKIGLEWNQAIVMRQGKKC